MRHCTERKRYLSGDKTRFGCELVLLHEGFGVLKYVIDQQWQVQDLMLRPGTVTYAFYWVDRPYNLYWWLDKGGETVGYYFNLADSVELSVGEFVWRDLVVDILVLPAFKSEAGEWQVRVIDEDEIPGTLSEELQTYIEAARGLVLRNYRAIIAEVTVVLEKHIHSRDQKNSPQ